MRGAGRVVRYLHASAIISPVGVYRYTLLRRWRQRPDRTFVVVGLNPSTADATTDDPTIRRCVSFAKREGCGALVMLNLYGLRSTDPAALWSHPDPIGPDNDKHIRALIAPRDLVVAAWGANARDPDRVAAVLGMIGPCFCLGTTKDGHPRHPLYVSGTRRLMPYGDGAA